jgi:hypothetical protein
METIEKLKLVEYTWRNYIWNYNFFRRELNFNDELKTNYVGVIFGYLNDTIPIFDKTELSNFSLENKFLNSIGILQLIYVQQDLIRELNKSFGINDKIDFGKNREIRNEIAGHPISRNRDKSLKSFCLYGFHPSELGDITYLKYHKENNFKFQASGYFTDDVIKNHLLMLNENLDKIIKKNKVLFLEFKKKLIYILENTETLDFKDLVSKVNEDFNNFLNSDKVFQFERLLKCFEQLKSHKRYEYNINLFLSELKASLIENINIINQKYLKKKEFISDADINDLPSNYLFGKLYDNHPIFGINYFIERFSENKDIIEELENMQNNLENEFEYYCSYNYLRYIINQNYPQFFDE